MPWALEEPQPLEEKVQLLRRFRGASISARTSCTGSSPRTRPRSSAEPGYTRASAKEPSRSVTGFVSPGASRVRDGVDCRCHAGWLRGLRRRPDRDSRGPGNEPSVAVPRLGFSEEARLRRRLRTQEGEEPRDVIVFTLFRDELSGSPAASAQVEAFDARGGEGLATVIHEIPLERRTLHGYFSRDLEPVLAVDSGDTIAFSCPNAGWWLTDDERFEERDPSSIEVTPSSARSRCVPRRPGRRWRCGSNRCVSRHSELPKREVGRRT